MKKIFAMLLAVSILALDTIACAPVYEICPRPGTETSESPLGTPIRGASESTMDAAVMWARSNGATEQFIDIAKYYWQYGEELGIRADLMYAQAARETGFGRFGRHATADMNNFAGIKKYDINDSTIDAHESFPTAQDGVRAHFNHMCAYIGAEPVGEPHGRYYTIMRMPWAGTINYIEELTGKWSVDPEYGARIAEMAQEMKKY